MSKEKILKAELDKVTDKLFEFGKPEKEKPQKQSKNKKVAVPKSASTATNSALP